MHRWFFIIIVLFLIAYNHSTVLADSGTPIYRARFKLFGTMDAPYCGSVSDGNSLRTYGKNPSTAAIADFKHLLRTFCKEEGIDAKIEEKTDRFGITTISSPTISAAINRYFLKGKLEASFFNGASEEELLSYAGSSYKWGCADDKKEPIIYGQNFNCTLHTVGVILCRLGCTQVKLYSTKDTMVPRCWVLLFSPSQKVKERLGIQKEAILADVMKEYRNMLLLEEEMRPNQSL